MKPSRRSRAAFAGLIAALALFVAAVLQAADDHGESGRLVIVANSRVAESIALAEFYAARRGIPPENIISLPMPQEETITWREFIDQIYQPLQDELVRRKWISALPSELVDRLGRKRYSITGHRMSYLVVCRGVPLRIWHDPVLPDERPKKGAHPQFETTQGAVDSELCLLANGRYAPAAFVPNPLFAKDRPASIEEEMIVKVTRLDGPTWEDARRLVLSAIEGEKRGMMGRYYLDMKGPHEDGDRWLDSVRTQLDELGFDGDVEATDTTFGAEARFDAPVLYFGWYAADIDGPFRREGFQFPAGAIALHVHSYSAETLRSADKGWVGPVVARGAAATVGNVFEPYLQLTHRPNLLLRALTQGATFGDAAYYSVPIVSWQSIAVGDPLYRPFSVGLEEQLKRDPATATSLDAYAYLREANLLERRQQAGEALEVLRSGLVRAPNLALSLAYGRRAAAAGDTAKAAEALEPARFIKEFRRDDWTIGRDIARELAALNSADSALKVFSTLSRSPAPTPAARLQMLQEAKRLADASGDLARSIEFARFINQAAETAGGER